MKKNLLVSEAEKKILSVENGDAKDFIPKAIIVRLSPKYKEKRIVNDWIAACRKIWNSSLDEVRRDQLIRKYREGIIPDLNVYLRDRFVIKKNMSPLFKERYKWTFRTPKNIREYVIINMVSSIKSGLTKIKKKQIKRFHLHEKNISDDRSTISVSHELVKILGTRKIKIFGVEFDTYDDLPVSITNNITITREYGQYFLALPSFSSPLIIEEYNDSNKKEDSNTHYKHKRTKKNKKNDLQVVNREGVVSIDPGINIFATYYSPTGEWGEAGRELKSFLENSYCKEERIKKNTFINSKDVKYRYTKALNKVRKRRKSKICDFQWKAAHWFLSNFNTILVSRLYVKNSNADLKRKQNDIKHCRFVDRLIYKSLMYKGRSIHIVKEHGTSALCTRCMREVKSKTDICYCDKCGLIVHRDLAGARNILLKHLS
jgi:putative transposase